MNNDTSELHIGDPHSGDVNPPQVVGLSLPTEIPTNIRNWVLAQIAQVLRQVPKLKTANGIAIGNKALATTATDGFLYIPTCAGAPSGVPTPQPGTVALVYDTTNHKFYIYDSGWKGGTNPGVFS